MTEIHRFCFVLGSFLRIRPDVLQRLIMRFAKLILHAASPNSPLSLSHSHAIISLTYFLTQVHFGFMLEASS